MTVPLWENEYSPSTNGCVFTSVRPPIVARLMWALKMRPRIDVARLNSPSAYAASGKRTSSGCSLSACL